MPATEGDQRNQDGADGEIRFSTEGRAFYETFGFPRVVDEQDRERFGVQPGDRCLDVGCGTGALTRVLLPAFDGQGELLGIDHDPDQLKQAQEEMNDVDIAQFQQADAFHLPYEDDAFDVVASKTLLCILPDPLDALEEMVRVCKPGGMVPSIICFCKSGSLPPFYGIADWNGRDRFEALNERFKEIYRTKIRNPQLGLPNGDDLALWGTYKEAGLVNLRIYGYMPVMAPADADWSDAEVEEYVRHRERISLDLLDGLSEEDNETMAAHGFSRKELAELRDLMAKRFSRLKNDPSTARSNMDVRVTPMVLITGRVPNRGG